MKRSLRLGNIYERAIRKLTEKIVCVIKTLKPLTQKLHGYSWKIFGHFFTFNIFQSPALFPHLSSSPLCIFGPCFRVSCSPVGGEQFGLLGCLCGLSVSRQAHMGERLLSELAASQPPRGPDRLSNLSSWKSQPDGGRDWPASGNLTTCLPALSPPPPPPLSGSPPPILTSVQQGKLYRPKGRLTSPDPWNRSD